MDELILTYLNQTLANPLLDILMVALTWAGFAALPGLGIALLIGPARRVGWAILAALGIGLTLVLLFQQFGGRVRPTAVRLILPMPNFPAYPSGHAAAAFSVAIVWGLHMRQRAHWAAALLAATLIALSRVYLGHHYPSDILGGAVLGAGIGAACYGLLLDEKPLRGRWLLWPQIALVLLVTQMAWLDALPPRLLRHWPSYTDKLLHFLLFGAVVFWLNLWWAGRRLWIGPLAVPLAVVIPLTLALAEELLQTLSPVRDASLGDLISDLAGMLCFWWLSEWVRNRQSDRVIERMSE